MKRSKEPLVKLTIQTASLETLPNMLPLYPSGRFFEIKEQVRQRISALKPTQYGFIPTPSASFPKPTEIEAIRNAIQSMFNRFAPDWKCRFSKRQAGIYFARKNDLVNFHKNGAEGTK